MSNIINLSTCEHCGANAPPGHGFYMPESTERICKECFFQARKNKSDSLSGIRRPI